MQTTTPKQPVPLPNHKGRWSAASHLRCGGVKREREDSLARKFATGRNRERSAR